MFSEIAIEGVIQQIVVQIKKELDENSENVEACIVLKRMGRFVLTQFEWSAPEWSTEYQEIFKE